MVTEAQVKAILQFNDWMSSKDRVPLEPLDTTAEPVSVSAGDCAPAKTASTAVKLWLIDTGCGHDLVARRELRALRKLIREANIPPQLLHR